MRIQGMEKWEEHTSTDYSRKTTWEDREWRRRKSIQALITIGKQHGKTGNGEVGRAYKH